MKLNEHIIKLLQDGLLMQVATIEKDKPWICTVYYVEDEQQNLYWLSLPTRRHSQALIKNSRAAVAIAVKQDQPVIGIQAEGKVRIVEDAANVKKVMKKYVSKYNAGKDFYKNFVAGKMQHRLYKFTPESFVLFDEMNFKEDPRQTWEPGV